MKLNLWMITLKKAKDISIIIACVGAIITLFATFENIRSSKHKDKFDAVEGSRKLFETEQKIKSDGYIFIRNYSSSIRSGKNVTKLVDNLINKYGSGAKAYYACDDKMMQEYRKICHHYEETGTLIKYQIIDFNFYYDVISFPDDFYNVTDALKKELRRNWKGPNAPMDGYLENFDKLFERYKKKRSK